MATRVTFGGRAMLIILLRLVSRLQMGRAVPPLSLYVCMALSGKSLPFFLIPALPGSNLGRDSDCHKWADTAFHPVAPSNDWDRTDDQPQPLPCRLHFPAHCHPLIRRNSISYRERCQKNIQSLGAVNRLRGWPHICPN